MPAIVFNEYTYTGISGSKYSPFYQNGNWHLVSANPVPFLHIVALCNIPEDEALILKLKFSDRPPDAQPIY